MQYIKNSLNAKYSLLQELPCQNWMPQILTRLGLGSWFGPLQTKKWQVMPCQNFWIWIPVLSFKQLTIPKIPCSVVFLQAHFTSHHSFYTKISQYGATSVSITSEATTEFMHFAPRSVANALPPYPSTGSASTAHSWVAIIPVIRPLHMRHSLPDKQDLALWTPPSPASCNVTFH